MCPVLGSTLLPYLQPGYLHEPLEKDCSGTPLTSTFTVGDTPDELVEEATCFTAIGETVKVREVYF